MATSKPEEKTESSTALPPPDLSTVAPVDPTPAVDTSVHLKDTNGVRYIGRADAKHISTRDLETLGIDARGDLVWDTSNGYFIQTDEINADTLHWLAAQPDFRVE